MTATLEAIRNAPVALYQLDDTAPFQDYSGYNRAGTMYSGTRSTALALLNGPSTSTVFSNTAIGRFDSPVFKQGYESRSFTLEAWVYPIVSTGDEQQILGNLDQMDGITIEGTIVSFVTKYLTTGEARASFDIQQIKRLHIVAVHTEASNMLFINGVLVDEVNISMDQQEDFFVATDAYLYSGASVGVQEIAVNNIALYPVSLSATDVARNYAAGNKHMSKEAVAAQFGGQRISLAKNYSNIFMEHVWDSADEWYSGYMDNVVTDGNVLRPAYIGGVSLAGTWMGVFPLDASELSSIFGVSLNWDGKGVVIEASVDSGTTWVTAERGKRLSNIPSDFDPTGKLLEVRVSFVGGLVEDPSYLNKIVITGFSTGVTQPVSNRVVTYSGSSHPQEEFEPVELEDSWGTELNGGSIVIGTDTSDEGAVEPRTLEIWIRANTTVAPTFNNVFETSYSNGESGLNLPVGQWVLLHLVDDAPITEPISITGDCQVGQAVVYETAITATTAKDIYNSYIGLVRVRVSDDSSIGVTESATGTTVYAHDWQITASG